MKVSAHLVYAQDDIWGISLTADGIEILGKSQHIVVGDETRHQNHDQNGSQCCQDQGFEIEKSGAVHFIRF